MVNIEQKWLMNIKGNVSAGSGEHAKTESCCCGGWGWSSTRRALSDTIRELSIWLVMLYHLFFRVFDYKNICLSKLVSKIKIWQKNGGRFRMVKQNQKCATGWISTMNFSRIMHAIVWQIRQNMFMFVGGIWRNISKISMKMVNIMRLRTVDKCASVSAKISP